MSRPSAVIGNDFFLAKDFNRISVRILRDHWDDRGRRRMTAPRSPTSPADSRQEQNSKRSPPRRGPVTERPRPGEAELGSPTDYAAAAAAARPAMRPEKRQPPRKVPSRDR